MEKFYIVTEESNLNKAYWKYKNNVKEVNEYVKSFMNKEGITANQYHVNAEKIYIIPTDEDLEVFNKILNKQLENGLRQFKLNSAIAKIWIKFVSDNNIKILHKPFVGTYFNAYGRSWSRLFNVGDTIYCTYESEFDLLTQKGLKKLKQVNFINQ